MTGATTVVPEWANTWENGQKARTDERPPWVPQYANHWDDTKPPAGWVHGFGRWFNLNIEEQRDEYAAAKKAAGHVDEAVHVDLQEADKGPDADVFPCRKCARPFTRPGPRAGHEKVCAGDTPTGG